MSHNQAQTKTEKKQPRIKIQLHQKASIVKTQSTKHRFAKENPFGKNIYPPKLEKKRDSKEDKDKDSKTLKTEKNFDFLGSKGHVSELRKQFTQYNTWLLTPKYL